MKLASRTLRATALAGAVACAAACTTATDAAEAHPPHAPAVFVQTDGLEGNQVVAYRRAADGTLTVVESYDTGGLGGALEGSEVDHLASQGSLTYDPQDALLYAVNAASDTVTVFAVSGERLALRQVIGSGGSFPVSVTVDNGLVYVLNALNGGFLKGFRVIGGRLVPMPLSGRPLGLGTSATPQFTNTPGQVAFSPEGSQLLVTTKANGSDVDVFGVGALGLLSARPVVNPLPGAVPFALTFDRDGHALVAEAGTGALAAFQLRADGMIVPLDSVATEQKATCWVVADGERFYVSNAGSASLSGFRSSRGGAQLSALGNTATNPGTVDAAIAGDGRYLYVQTGAEGILDEFSVAARGALTEVGTVTVPGAIGGEGIAAL